MNKLNRVILFLLLVLFSFANKASASYEEYMYYSKLQMEQNKGVIVPKIENSQYEILKERTEQGIIKRTFSTKTFDLLYEMFFDKNGMKMMRKDYYHFVSINQKNDNMFVMSLSYIDDKTINQELVFDANDNLPEYILSNKKNTLIKLEKKMSLKGNAISVYKNNVIFKTHMFLENDQGKTMDIYINYNNGMLIKEDEYNNLI